MTEDKGIFIRNVYYMLAYAFQELNQNNYEDIAKEDFEHIYDLFAEILYKGVSMQLKQGLYREYVEKTECLSTLKGKLDINGTIKERLNRRQIVSCEFDELNENNTFNKILKATIELLISGKTVKTKRKTALRSLLPFFSNVESVFPSSIKWNALTYKRSNRSYRMLMNICYFIIDGMLMTTERGTYRMATFSDEHMNRLFERFVLEYYRVHHKDIRANSEKLDWFIDTENKAYCIEFLPSMHTDIVLRKGDKSLIIDTKYYGKILHSQYDKKTISSGNMYQIFSYVKNMDPENTGNVSGMLLYAKTDEDIAEPIDAYFGKNRIIVNTLDLNQEFGKIKEQLDNIAALIYL